MVESKGSLLDKDVDVEIGAKDMMPFLNFLEMRLRLRVGRNPKPECEEL